jgi:PAS domain-containing protein
MREQERSKRISSQISQLKDLLAAANVRFKPDKFNTLVSVHSYIRTLQQRQALLDEEHQKLVNTITKSNELVAKSQTGHCTNSSLEEVPETSSGQNIIPRSQTTHSVDEEILAFVRGLDYKNVFSKIQIALCVTSIDGRLLDCNDEFARVCSLSRDLLVSSGLRKPDEMDPVEKAEAGKSPLSLFNLMASRMSREDMQHVFEAMSNMLKQAHVSNDDSSESIHPDGGVKQTHSDMMKYDHWSTEIMKCQNSTQKLQLNISLVRRKGMPRFFNCALTNIEQE